MTPVSNAIPVLNLKAEGHYSFIVASFVAENKRQYVMRVAKNGTATRESSQPKNIFSRLLRESPNTAIAYEGEGYLAIQVDGAVIHYRCQAIDDRAANPTRVQRLLRSEFPDAVIEQE